MIITCHTASCVYYQTLSLFEDGFYIGTRLTYFSHIAINGVSLISGVYAIMCTFNYYGIHYYVPAIVILAAFLDLEK